VITKDLDFLNDHLLLGTPQRLLLVSTGNISNRRLLMLFKKNLGLILESLRESTLVELTESGLVKREGRKTD